MFRALESIHLVVCYAFDSDQRQSDRDQHDIVKIQDGRRWWSSVVSCRDEW